MVPCGNSVILENANQAIGQFCSPAVPPREMSSCSLHDQKLIWFQTQGEILDWSRTMSLLRVSVFFLFWRFTGGPQEVWEILDRISWLTPKLTQSPWDHLNLNHSWYHRSTQNHKRLLYNGQACVQRHLRSSFWLELQSSTARQVPLTDLVTSFYPTSDTLVYQALCCTSGARKRIAGLWRTKV